MTKKEAFIEMVDQMFDVISINELNLSKEQFNMASEYFDELKAKGNTSPSKVELTSNGAMILAYMQDNHINCDNKFKAKDIGEGLFISSRSVSGSMKKLVTEGFVEKIGNDPTIYSITDKGKEKNLK